MLLKFGYILFIYPLNNPINNITSQYKYKSNKPGTNAGNDVLPGMTGMTNFIAPNSTSSTNTATMNEDIAVRNMGKIEELLRQQKKDNIQPDNTIVKPPPITDVNTPPPTNSDDNKVNTVRTVSPKNPNALSKAINGNASPSMDKLTNLIERQYQKVIHYSDETKSEMLLTPGKSDMPINHELVKWLLDIGLQEYYPNFIKNGFDDVKVLSKIHSDRVLKRIGINKLGHRIKILTKINQTNNKHSLNSIWEESDPDESSVSTGLVQSQNEYSKYKKWKHNKVLQVYLFSFNMYVFIYK